MRRLKEETSLELYRTLLGAHAVPRHMNADEYIDLVIDGMLPRVAGEKLAEFATYFASRVFRHRTIEKNLTQPGNSD